MSNTWDGYDERYYRPEPISISPASICHEFYQLLLLETPRFPIMSIEPEVASPGGYFAGEFTRFPAVNLSQTEIEALGGQVECCLGDGVIVAKFKGKSPDTPLSDE